MNPMQEAQPPLGPTRRAVLALAATASVTASGSAWAQPSLSTIHLVSDAWHGLTRKDGTGLYFDLIRAVFRQRQVQIKVDIVPYARSVQMVLDKQADGWVASFMNEKDFPLYPRWHFDRNAQMVLFRKRPGHTFSGASALRDKRVAWLRDFGLDRYIGEPMKITEVDTIQSAMQMLVYDRIDYFVGAQSDLQDDIKARKVDMSGFEMTFLMNLGLYVAFANTPRGEHFRTVWDDVMKDFHKTDAFKAIYRRAGYPYPF